MKLSTKGRYGLRALIDLAQHGGEGPVSITSIAERQEISERYLEQLMSKLKKAGIIQSIRGAQGGYVLAKELEEVRPLWQSDFHIVPSITDDEAGILTGHLMGRTVASAPKPGKRR